MSNSDLEPKSILKLEILVRLYFSDLETEIIELINYFIIYQNRLKQLKGDDIERIEKQKDFHIGGVPSYTYKIPEDIITNQNRFNDSLIEITKKSKILIKTIMKVNQTNKGCV